MRGRGHVLLLVLTVLLASVFAPVPVGAQTAGSTAPAPTSMAALGDSISRGFNACGFYFDCTARSWTTGEGRDRVSSHYERFRALGAATSGAYNDARTGARVRDLPGQASAAVGQGAGYVTILVGANDACTSTESTMTPVADFETSFRSAMATLDPDGRGVRVLVVSIPDLYQLWQAGKGSFSARTAWSAYGICRSMLANPTSTSRADEDRRLRVRQRVVDYNSAMARVCSGYVKCRYDGGVVFGYQFQLSQLSTWDYFHPNEAGQAVLAEQTWLAGFSWTAPAAGTTVG
jgi:lysophospholipase L1-like esterase